MKIVISVIDLMKALDEMFPSDDSKWDMLHKLLEAQMRSAEHHVHPSEVEQAHGDGKCHACGVVVQKNGFCWQGHDNNPVTP